MWWKSHFPSWQCRDIAQRERQTWMLVSFPFSFHAHCYPLCPAFSPRKTKDNVCLYVVRKWQISFNLLTVWSRRSQHANAPSRQSQRTRSPARTYETQCDLLPFSSCTLTTLPFVKRTNSLASPAVHASALLSHMQNGTGSSERNKMNRKSSIRTLIASLHTMGRQEGSRKEAGERFGEVKWVFGWNVMWKCGIISCRREAKI